MLFLIRHVMIHILVLKIKMVIFMSVYQESVSLFAQTSFADSNTVRAFIATMRVNANHENAGCLLVNAPQDVAMKYSETLGYQIMNGHVRKEDPDLHILIQSVRLVMTIFVLKNMVRVILANLLLIEMKTEIYRIFVKAQNGPTPMWDWGAFCHRSMDTPQRMHLSRGIGMKLYLDLLGKHMVYLLLLVLLMVNHVGMAILV